MDFIKTLIKKDKELKETGHRPIFTSDELKLIKTTLKLGLKRLEMRNKTFVVRYFKWKKQEWITVRPQRGFVPMFSAPYDDVMKAEII